MTNESKLIVIKTLHTAIWLFFNVVIFYMLYAAIIGKLDVWLWIGYGLILAEGIVLVLFKLTCPLTVIARKYSNLGNDNFDIYLPNWLARHTKRIYTGIVVVILIITIVRVF